MGDVVALIVGALACMVGFVVHQVRKDARAGRATDAGWRGWLLVVLAVACVVGAVVLFWSRLFSG